MSQAVEERRQILDAELKRIIALVIKQYTPEKIILFGSEVIFDKDKQMA